MEPLPVRSAVVKRWRLQRYPFDDQMLHVQIGLADPLAAVNLDVADPDPFAVSPGLVLPGWTLEQPGACLLYTSDAADE